MPLGLRVSCSLTRRIGERGGSQQDEAGQSSERLCLVAGSCRAPCLVWVRLGCGTGLGRQVGSALQPPFALQNGASSASTRRACSSTSAVSASCWPSGKRTPSSVLCARGKRFQTPFSVTGGWRVPPQAGCPEGSGGPAVPAPARCDAGSASRSNLRVSGGVVTCPCGLSLSSHVSVPHTHPVSLLPTCVCLLEALCWCWSRWGAFAPGALASSRRCLGSSHRAHRAHRPHGAGPGMGAHCGCPSRLVPAGERPVLKTFTGSWKHLYLPLCEVST